MTSVDFQQPQALQWQPVSEGVERAAPGENRVLIKIGAGRAYPHHAHVTPDEAFVVDGVYVDSSIENGRPFEAGSYLYYPHGTEHHASSPSGCTILVWNADMPKA